MYTHGHPYQALTTENALPLARELTTMPCLAKGCGESHPSDAPAMAEHLIRACEECDFTLDAVREMMIMAFHVRDYGDGSLYKSPEEIRAILRKVQSGLDRKNNLVTAAG